MKRYVVNVKEAVTGKLPVAGGGGIFRILIDEETSGAKHFSLLVNDAKSDEAKMAHLSVERLLHQELERRFRSFILEADVF